MIQLSRVQKKFGQRVAVSDLTLTVPRGEIFGLLGHNGAGKSTAIGMMLGQVWPTSGEVKVCGHDVTRHRARALHKVGAIFETPAFYDYLSGFNMKSAAATILALSYLSVNVVMEGIPFFDRYENWFITHHFRCWLYVFQSPVQWAEILQSEVILFGASATVFTSVARLFRCVISSPECRLLRSRIGLGGGLLE